MKRLTAAVINAGLLNKLQSKTPANQKKAWPYTSGNSRRFKNALSAHLKVEQSNRCAYCGLRLMELNPARDHIAPMEFHPEFTFFPNNLVLACYHCNTDCKGAADTIATKNGTYETCIFSIIHPYLDDPTQHLEFVGGRRKLLIKVIGGSPKGRETVRLFRLANAARALQRAKDVLFDEDLAHLPGQWRGQMDNLLPLLNLKMQLRA
jgi:uncharacterized protein (TIGR02646 family)